VRRVQSIGKLVASQAEYYTEQLRHSVGEDVPVLRGDRMPAQVDYYAGHESPSRWMGSGLGRVGLEDGGDVSSETFAKLMRHETPDGDSMIRRYASHGKVAAFDHTFSAPKSVSLLYAFGDDRIRGEVRAGHQRAVADAVRYMEEHASQSRQANKHKDDAGRWKVSTRTLESEGYLAAAFDHFTSRASDPQVHTHVVVINRVWAGEGWRALDAKRAYAHAKAGGSVYQSVLRNELTQRLGVSWQPVVNGVADVAGFSPELIRHFSTRRTEIVEAVERYLAQVGGDTHRRVWHTFTLETRQPKSYPTGEAEVTREMRDYGITGDVVAHWQRRAMDAPDDVVSVVRAAVGDARPSMRPSDGQLREAAQSLVEWVSDRQAVFTERDLVAHVSSLFPDGANEAELVATTGELLRAAQESGDVLTILPHAETGLILPEGIVLSTEELDIAAGHGLGWVQQGGTVRFRALPGEARYTTRLHLEREQRVLRAVKAHAAVVPDREALEQAIRVRELVEGQAEAVRHLAELDGRVVAVVGPGGSGKTYSIGAYADAIAAAGHPVVGVATSAAAARRLGEDLGGQWTGTIAMFRHQLDASPYPLRPGTLVVVDEASMVSTADLAWLVDKAEACDGKLVLVGDPNQLPSVDSGGLFHRIVASGDQVVDDLVEVNQRQELDLDRRILTRMRAGEIERAVHDYAEAGRLHLGRDEYSTKAAMVDAWWTDVHDYGLAGVRMLASRHDEVQMLNQLARVRVREAGEITGPALVNRWGIEYQAGDRIVVRDNWYAHADLRNGQTGTVLAVHASHGSLTFRRDLDGEVIELPKRYLDRNVDHAYAQTIHTAQGQTFLRTHVYADTGVRAEHGYTALSRARGETHLWINDAPGPLGECTYIHGDPLFDDRVAALVRQLSQSVIEPPALDQGMPMAIASDQQLIEWRNDLEELIRRSPIAVDVTDQLAALEAAIDEATEIAERLKTSGAHAQLEALKAKHADFVDQVNVRETWLEDNAGVLHRYSMVAEELSHRVNARTAACELVPPKDILESLCSAPKDLEARRKWIAAVGLYVEARMSLGTEADLYDPVVAPAAAWRDAVDSYARKDGVSVTSPEPVLRQVL
jgi:conjugative relaxase-like TrwC/TraI family protein